MTGDKFKRTILQLKGGGQVAVLEATQHEPQESTGMTIEAKARYELEQLLGRGGMGTVWKARAKFLGAPGPQDDVERTVAIKVVSGFDPNSDLSKRLVKEARLIAQLNHENIVKFEGWDYIPETKSYFIVMEYIKGIDVDRLMELHGLNRLPQQTRKIRRIPDKIVGFLLFSVGNALAYAHNYCFEHGQIGVLHRDISPGNILIKMDEGVIKLSDFGIAVTPEDLAGEGGVISGKIPYLPPESVMKFETKKRPKNPLQIDPRADLYTLGVVAYEMLTGFRPNDSIEEAQTLHEQLGNVVEAMTKELVPPHEIVQGVDKDLSAIVCKLLEQNPDRRYNSAEDLVDAVGRQYLYNKRYGPTKTGLREYIRVLQDTNNATSKTPRILRFLKEHWWSKLTVFAPYVLRDSARRMIEKGKNPARV
jgi:serine/threonine-protein kinase